MNEKEFISSWTSKLVSDGIKNFPNDFFSFKNFSQRDVRQDSFGGFPKELKLPGKTLLIGEEFFGKHEIITTSGESVLHSDNYFQAKFILYANRNTPELIHIPTEEADLKKAVQLYEAYLDSLIKNIENGYKKTFPEEKNSKFVVNEIFRQLNLVRI